MIDKELHSRMVKGIKKKRCPYCQGIQPEDEKRDLHKKCRMYAEEKKKVEKIKMDLITKDDFLDYEAVRESGKTNMFDITKVVGLSQNLDRDKIIEIMKNYNELKNKYIGDKK